MSDSAPATPAAAATSVTVTLEEGIVRGDQTITTLTLRRPRAGELRGLSLQDIMTGQAGAVMTLLPRISDPTLIDSEVQNLSPADLAELGGTIMGFFMTARQREMVSQLMSTS